MIVAADATGLEAAARALLAGLAVGLPTDTVYGLAVDPTLDQATDRLFAAKLRPRRLPIAVLVADADQAWALSRPNPSAVGLARGHWPGALTLVVARAPGWQADLGDAGETVGVRCPAHEWVRALCRRVGPLATTSANVHREPTPPDAAGVEALFGTALALVVDGGLVTGQPSTVVDCTTEPPIVLRAGRLSPSALGLAGTSKDAPGLR